VFEARISEHDRMTLRLLAVGDLHLGRRPTRLPEALAGRLEDFAPAAAWQRTVDLAVRESVDAVVLAGDVVESRHDYFEALPRLQAGVARLAQAGIQTLAVSGNHDVDVLPRLIDRVPDAHLLGRDGRWESIALSAASGEQATLWGWSFPSAHFRSSPLDALPRERGAGPHLGLLHCDRDQTGSPYAPVTGIALRDAGLDAWLLGHIHQPDALGVDHPHGYLGSVVGLDAKETGARGPWMLEIDAGRLRRFDHRPLAPLRWDALSVDLTGADDEATVTQRLDTSLETLAATLAAHREQPELVGLRLRLTGECALGASAIEAALPPTERMLRLPGAQTIDWFLESFRLDTRPITPLERLAERDDPPGLLARRLLILQRDADDPEREALLAAAEKQLQTVTDNPRWQQLPGDRPSRETLAETLRETGQNALRVMLDQERV
jgi:DNA repair exonuclease SbcCD nuclease subunit